MRQSFTRRRVCLVMLLLGVLLSALLVVPVPRAVEAQQEGSRKLELESTPQQSGRRLALVIGNGVYQNAPTLKNPPNDATDMAKALSDVGFTVEHGVNLTQKQMKFMIREFGQRLRGGGQGLFYFAGHGVQLRGRNYLIPVEADIQSEADVEDQGVDASLVLGLMDEANNGLNVVIMDACRNNPFARSFRSAASGLAQVDAPTGTLIAYATAPGKVARDGVGRNGAYTAELLKQMRVPGLGIEELLKRVRASLKQQTNGEQVPWESSSLVGDFYLNRAASAPSAANNAPSGAGNAAAVNPPSISPADPTAVDLAYWQAIQNSTDPADFQAYLEKFPNGAFAALARKRAYPTLPASTETLPMPTVDQMLDKYLQAIGGKTALEKLISRVTKGSFVQIGGDQPNLSLTFESYSEAPNKHLFVNSGGYQQGFNGAIGWIKNNGKLRRLTGEQLANMKRGSDFYADTHRSELYAKISFIRRDKVNGREVYVFEATPPDGKPETLYFDIETALLLRIDVYSEAEKGKLASTETYFEDYREVDGIKLPFTTRQVGSGYSITYRVFEVKHNIPIDDAKFDGPSKR